MYNFDQYMKQQAALADKLEKAQEQKRSGITESVDVLHREKKDGHYAKRTVRVHRDMPDGTREHAMIHDENRLTSLAGKSMTAHGKYGDEGKVEYTSSNHEGYHKNLLGMKRSDPSDRRSEMVPEHEHGATMKAQLVAANHVRNIDDHQLATHLNTNSGTTGWKASSADEHHDWFSQLSKEAQEKYLDEHPHNRFHHGVIDSPGFNPAHPLHVVAKKIAKHLQTSADLDAAKWKHQPQMTASTEFHPDGSASVHTLHKGFGSKYDAQRVMYKALGGEAGSYREGEGNARHDVTRTESGVHIHHSEGKTNRETGEETYSHHMREPKVDYTKFKDLD